MSYDLRNRFSLCSLGKTANRFLRNVVLHAAVILDRTACSLPNSLLKKLWELIGSNGYSHGSGLEELRGDQ